MPTKYRTIWISDVHLGTPGCHADYLHNFLKHNYCETLYLVGDIIDGWYMSRNRASWTQHQNNVVRKILSLAKKEETRVIYIPGNHDEFLRDGYANEEPIDLGNIHIYHEYVHITADRRKLLIIHGDEFDGVTRYHKWVSHLGDMSYQALLKINRWYNYLRKRFGYGYWSLSAYLKHKVKQAVSFISSYEESIAFECKRRGFDGVVCGHIHHAEIKTINDIQYYNCGDWVESCTALVEDYNGNIKIIHWTKSNEDSSSN